MAVMIKAFGFAFLATVAFGIIFQGPKKVLWQSGLIGAVGWVVFTTLKYDYGIGSFTANFLATVMVSLLSEICARTFQQPATVFTIPAVIPLVPGLGMYQGMHLILLDDMSRGSEVLVHAGLDACAIALGIMMVSGAFRAFKTGAELALFRKRKRREAREREESGREDS